MNAHSPDSFDVWLTAVVERMESEGVYSLTRDETSRARKYAEFPAFRLRLVRLFGAVVLPIAPKERKGWVPRLVEKAA